MRYTAEVRTGRLICGLVAGAIFALFAFACTHADVPIGAAGEAGIPDVTLAEGAWGTTACATCTFSACALEHTDCRSDPGCARNLDCVEGCSATPGGDPVPACVDACPLTASTMSESRRLALERCRLTGGATGCPTCSAAGRRKYQNPLLTNTCEGESYDAGPGATPTKERCAKCVADRCCMARQACRDDDGCYPLLDCDEACQDGACEDACLARYDGSVGHAFALSGCGAVRCQDECDGRANACAACTRDRCGDPFIDCLSDHDCYLLTQCVRPCGDVECIDGCNARYPSGREAFNALDECALARCGGPCRR